MQRTDCEHSVNSSHVWADFLILYHLRLVNQGWFYILNRTAPIGYHHPIGGFPHHTAPSEDCMVWICCCRCPDCGCSGQMPEWALTHHPGWKENGFFYGNCSHEVTVFGFGIGDYAWIFHNFIWLPCVDSTIFGTIYNNCITDIILDNFWNRYLF